jgi:hypothetical protein
MAMFGTVPTGEGADTRTGESSVKDLDEIGFAIKGHK